LALLLLLLPQLLLSATLCHVHARNVLRKRHPAHRAAVVLLLLLLQLPQLLLPPFA
jgi:hypothetical protein